MNPPKNEKYEALKTELLNRLSELYEQKSTIAPHHRRNIAATSVTENKEIEILRDDYPSIVGIAAVQEVAPIQDCVFSTKYFGAMLENVLKPCAYIKQENIDIRLRRVVT